MTYSLAASWLYSNQQAFQNLVYPNTSHFQYNAPSGHDPNQGYYQLNPGTIFVIMNIVMTFCFVYLLVKIIKEHFCQSRTNRYFGESKFRCLRCKLLTQSD